MNKMIPYGRQYISDSDVKAVTDVLRSDFLTQGPAVPSFEKALAENVEAKFAVAVNSATSALHIACMAMGVSKGDIVWTSPISFAASANCALYCGANIDFVDISLSTFNICTNALKDKLIVSKKAGKLPKVLIVVHMCGLSCDMSEIKSLSREFGFMIIEDASHAVGARYLNSKVGSCEYSDVTIFSFHPVKIITTGEGGVALTNSELLANKMRLLRSHGITRDKSEFFDVDYEEGDWSYQQIELGFNYRMTDIQAALGLSQLIRLEKIVNTRNKIAKHYNEMFDGTDVHCQKIPDGSLSSYHLFVIQVQNRKNIFNKLRQSGVGVNVHYMPIYRHPYYKRVLGEFKPLPNAEAYYSKTISLPMFPELTVEEQDFIIKVILNGAL